jgi:hypothetical protein
MVTVTLARDWTDANGKKHPRGTQVQIPESLLDDLVAQGYVSIGGDERPDGIRWS